MALEVRQRTDTGAIAIKHSHDRWQVVDGDLNHYVGDDAVEQWSPLEGLVPVEHAVESIDDIPALGENGGAANQGTLSADAHAVEN